MNYLRDDTLRQDLKERNQIIKSSQWFLLYEAFLYKRVFALPLLDVQQRKMAGGS